MPVLKNSRHEKFAQLVASGDPQANAYVSAGYAQTGCHANASRLIAQDNISARIAEIREKAATKADITKADVIKFLRKFVEFDIMLEPMKRSDQLKAAEIIIKLCGFAEPEKVQLGANSELTELLKKLRGSGC